MSRKVWTKQEISEQLKTEAKWRARALLAIYRNQTDAEKAAGRTIAYNGIGFNGADAVPLTRIAQRMLAGSQLHPRDWLIINRRIHKYVGQLVKIANGESSK